MGVSVVASRAFTFLSAGGASEAWVVVPALESVCSVSERHLIEAAAWSPVRPLIAGTLVALAPPIEIS